MNKEIEKFQLEQFFKSMEIENPIINSDEQPDFIVNTLDNTFGVEITSIHQERESAIAGTQRKIVRNACIKASENGLEPVEVKVWFNNIRPSNTKRYIKGGTDYLYDIVISNIENIKSKNGQLVEIDTNKNSYNINKIVAHWNTLNGYRWLKEHRWITIEPGFVTKAFYEIIQKEISKKNKKILKYKEKCKECWLIIVIDRTKKDEHFDYSLMDKQAVYISKFEKTYIFDIAEKKVYLLNIEKGNA